MMWDRKYKIINDPTGKPNDHLLLFSISNDIHSNKSHLLFIKTSRHGKKKYSITVSFQSAIGARCYRNLFFENKGDTLFFPRVSVQSKVFARQRISGPQIAMFVRVDFIEGRDQRMVS